MEDLISANQNESDVLTKFEIDHIPEQYREYYEKKRHNLFASIQAYPLIWDCFMLLDRIFLKEFDDCQNASATEQMPALLLYMNAHSKARTSLELGFSTSPAEAFSIMRDAVESAAFAHKMLLDPNLVRTWVERDNGQLEADRFRTAFIEHRQSQLFDGLPELYDFWKRFSDIGSHTNMNSIVQQFVIEETATHVGWKFNYTGAHTPRALAGSLFIILLAMRCIENMLFKDFHPRLHLDNVLVDLRVKFENEKEACRKHIIARYDIATRS